MGRLRVFTWHVHGSYLFSLAQSPHDFFLPVKPGRPHGYGGRAGAWSWPANVHEVPAEQVARERFDCILFQDRAHYLVDQHRLFSPAQRTLPRIYLEHDPPLDHPTEQRHWVDDPDTLLVHVTPFNALMWNCGATPTAVVEHGVVVPEDARYTGERLRGVTAVNNLRTRGRRCGLDLFQSVREQVPLDLVGMDARSVGGLGEVSPPDLPAFLSAYRFYFNPSRYTSLNLAVLEAMAVGLPVVGLATTEMASSLRDGVTAHLDTRVSELTRRARELLLDPAGARAMGEAGRRLALTRFGIDRFASDWDRTLRSVAGRGGARVATGDVGGASISGGAA
jgi:Glycosyl transferases group 1